MNDFDNKQICLYKDIDRLGFTCDVCGIKVNGCSIVNGMKFCAKCYQETFGKDNQQNEIQQLKQQLEEKDNYHLRYELAGADETITNLKEQLAEKDCRIEELEGQFAYECECNKQLVELQKQLAEKDKEINSLIVDYEKRISQEQELMSNMEHRLTEKDTRIAELEDKDWYEACIKQLEEQNNRLIDTLKEKDKEIEKLKQQYTILENENGKLTTELIMDKYKKAQKEVSFGKQLAIQELAEVERLLYESHYKEIDNRYYAVYEDIKNLIDSRIQALEELRGEKDVKD